LVLRPPPESGEWVQILEADPGLAHAVPESTRDDAAIFALALTRWLEPGEWQPARESGDGSGQLGLLVLEGFMVRQVHVVDRPPAELLGPGDLLHPWEPDHTEPFVAGARFDVLEPTRLAVLDRRFAAVISRWPDLVAALVARAIARSRSLLLNLAIGQLVGVDIRLLVMLWHIAERWGHPVSDGCLVPVHLTHQLLASLISAQRPTVTSALAALCDKGLMTRRPDGLIVLHGEPPTEFRHLRSTLP
jgi:CRP/FNR family transcriptional regulator, cyclic AMP receptor protein